MATRFNVIQQHTKRTFWRNLRDPRPAIWRLVLRAAVCVSASSCGIYSADEITATVVDADTKAPIEGVNVIAGWVVRGGINYGNTVGYMNVMETVTSGDGKFHFRSWGPRANLHLGEIRREAPTLMLFKSGYRYTAAENNGSSLAAAPSAMKSDWNDKTILMKRYAGTMPDYDAGYTALWTDLTFLRDHGHWSAIPQFLCAVGREHDSLSVRGASNSLYSFNALSGAGIDCKLERETR
jgi:hypothetical protein